MRIDNKIRDEEIQNNINREAEKVSAVLSAKNDKCENITI